MKWLEFNILLFKCIMLKNARGVGAKGYVGAKLSTCLSFKYFHIPYHIIFLMTLLIQIICI